MDEQSEVSNSALGNVRSKLNEKSANHSPGRLHFMGLHSFTIGWQHLTERDDKPQGKSATQQPFSASGVVKLCSLYT